MSLKAIFDLSALREPTEDRLKYSTSVLKPDVLLGYSFGDISDKNGHTDNKSDYKCSFQI